MLVVDGRHGTEATERFLLCPHRWRRRHSSPSSHSVPKLDAHRGGAVFGWGICGSLGEVKLVDVVVGLRSCSVGIDHRHRPIQSCQSRICQRGALACSHHLCGIHLGSDNVVLCCWIRRRTVCRARDLFGTRGPLSSRAALRGWGRGASLYFGPCQSNRWTASERRSVAAADRDCVVLCPRYLRTAHGSPREFARARRRCGGGREHWFGRLDVCTRALEPRPSPSGSSRNRQRCFYLGWSKVCVGRTVGNWGNVGVAARAGPAPDPDHGSCRRVCHLHQHDRRAEGGSSE